MRSLETCLLTTCLYYTDTQFLSIKISQCEFHFSIFGFFSLDFKWVFETNMNAKQLEEEIKYYVFENGRSILFLLVAWTVGWYGFSYTWLLIGVLILLWWRNKTEVRSAKRKALRLLVNDERKFVLSYKCLPSWVSLIHVKEKQIKPPWLSNTCAAYITGAG